MPSNQAIHARRAQMPQTVERFSAGETGAQRIKNGPEDRGHSSKVEFHLAFRSESGAAANAIPAASETEVGQVAVAVGDAGAGHQQAVDRGHHAGEQGVLGYEADGSSLGHGCPLLLRCGTVPPRHLGSIYVYQIPVTTDLFA